MVAEKTHILVVEDEPDVLELLRFNLSKEGFAVTTAMSGEDGLRAVAQKRPHLILLDVMLPGLNGLDVCRQLKRDPKTASILITMVTARSEETDIVAGFEVEADDYVTKPFSVKALVSRIRATLRRTQVPTPEAKKRELYLRDLEISPGRFLVLAGGKPIEGLTLMEFNLLYFLASHSGWVLTRQQILDAVRGEEVAVTERAVDVQMVGLRKKLGQRAEYIEAVRGVGYRFRDK